MKNKIEQDREICDKTCYSKHWTRFKKEKSQWWRHTKYKIGKNKNAREHFHAVLKNEYYHNEKKNCFIKSNQNKCPATSANINIIHVFVF